MDVDPLVVLFGIFIIFLITVLAPNPLDPVINGFFKALAGVCNIGTENSHKADCLGKVDLFHVLYYVAGSIDGLIAFLKLINP